jgi:two-component sensor histidine kinase
MKISAIRSKKGHDLWWGAQLSHREKGCLMQQQHWVFFGPLSPPWWLVNGEGACIRSDRPGILDQCAIRVLRYPNLKTYISQFGHLPASTRQRVMRQVLAILLAASVVTAVAAWESRKLETEAAAANFDSLSDKVVISIDENMEAYEQVLRGGVSLFHALGNVTRKQWSVYVSGLKLPETYPGIQGVGYAAVIDLTQIPAIERRAHDEGWNAFRVQPTVRRELNTTILYLEPLDWRNERALGFDMYSERVRREAMQRAWKTGRPAMTGGVSLLQETSEDVQRGVLLYLPVFEGEDDPSGAQHGEGTLKGFVFSPFRMGDLMSRVLARTDSYSRDLIRVEVYDGPAPTPDALLFDSEAGSKKGGDFTPAYSQFRQVRVHGVLWTIKLHSLSEFERQAASASPYYIAGVGLLLGALAAALFGLVNIGKETAHFVANQLSSEIEIRKKAQEQTRVALGELGHRVKNTLTVVTAIASQTVRHSADLKEFDAKFRDRLLGLSRVHDLLTSGRNYATDLAQLAREVLKPYKSDHGAALVLDGAAAPLTPNTAILLSMLFNELATNATKYGAWSVKNGRVTLSWQISEASDEGTLDIVWEERGGPRVVAPTRQGFGSSLIKYSIERSLRGKADADYSPDGVTYKISVPWKSAETDDPEPTGTARRSS